VVPQGKAPSTDRLLGAEAATLSAGGNVLRLVGLYHSNRGAHTFFARQQEVARPGKYVVNLLHYEDAASLAVAILKGAGSPGGEPYRSRVFLGCDNHPITFENMMAAVFDSGVMSGSVTFTGDVVTGGAGKSVNNDATRQQLGWTPKYNSFKDFFAAGAKDYYNSAETVKVGGMPHA
jgi:nucleoside-diphosphate-sugar epimerase